MKTPLINPNNIELLKQAIDQACVTGSFLPSIYVVEPTNRCNVNCIMCPNSRFPAEKLGDVDDELFDQIVEQIAPYAELTMLYFLGESTLHPRFGDLLITARKKLKGRIVISTNGLDLSDSSIESLIQNADIIITCIDRWNKKAYERIRQGSNFEGVVASVERLLEAQRSSSKAVIVVKTLDIALKGESAGLLKEEAAEFERYWSRRGAIPLGGWLNTWAGQFAQLRSLATSPTPYTEASRSACADLWFKMIINWRGEAVICCHDWSSSTVLGSVQNQALREIWHSEQMTSLRREHLKANFSCNRLCVNCREWGTRDELDSYVNLTKEDLYRIF